MRLVLAISIIDSRAAPALNRNVIEDSLMQRNRILISMALAAMAAACSPLMAATFGTVVPTTGHASDIALDEARGKLYIANFTANRIDVMSTADNTIRTSMNVGAQPGSISLSVSGRY